MHINLVTLTEFSFRVWIFLRPRNLTNVYQSLNTRLEFNKQTVRHDVGDTTLVSGLGWEAFIDVLPWIFCKSLE